MKEFWKSVNIWRRSYRHGLEVCVWDTVYIIRLWDISECSCEWFDIKSLRRWLYIGILHVDRAELHYFSGILTNMNLWFHTFAPGIFVCFFSQRVLRCFGIGAYTYIARVTADGYFCTDLSVDDAVVMWWRS